MITVKCIHIYPVKSLPPIMVTEHEIIPEGLKLDRNWMLTDFEGKFITQRKFPQLAKVKVSLQKDYLGFAVNDSEIKVPFDSFERPDKAVVWDDPLEVLGGDSSIDTWFSDFLGFSCKLVRFKEGQKRNSQYNQGQVSFADRLPLLLINEASVQDLKEKHELHLSPLHFRPNIVLSGALPFEEDTWRLFSIGKTKMKGEGPCMRCKMIGINPYTGEVEKDALSHLKQIRGNKEGTPFGLLCSPLNTGVIRKGDTLQIAQSEK